MALTKRTESNIVYLQAKHFCLWREIKYPAAGCDQVEVTNPKTKETITKYGYSYDTVSGHVTKLEKYDTERKYSTRYFGFKIHFQDGPDKYVLDMPYQSAILRRFLRLAHNVDWKLPLCLTVFKGKPESGKDAQIAFWFQQRGETVKAYYTKEQPHGMPAAIYDSDLQTWDFKEQHRWLIERLKTETIPDIEDAAKRTAPPSEHHHELPPDEQPQGAPVDWHEQDISDDDVPF